MIQDRAAELACLALLLSEDQATVLEGLSVFTSTDFHSHDGDIARIVGAIERCVRAGHPVTLLAIRAELQTSGELERVGGIEKLLAMVREYPCENGHVRLPDTEGGFVLANMAYASSLVRESADARTLIATCEQTADALRQPERQLTVGLARARLSEAITDMRDSAFHGAESDLEAHESMQAWFDRLRGNIPIGIDTGINAYDELTGGLQPAGYVLITAGDKQGKSTLALTLANYIVRSGTPVLYVSPEMTALELRCRRIAMNSGKQLAVFKLLSNRRRLTDRDHDLANTIWNRISTDPIYTDTDSTTPDQIVLEIERQCIVNQVRVAVIDYLQLPCEPTETAITEFSKKLALMGKRLADRGIPLTEIVLNQLNSEGNEQSKLWGSPSSDYSYMSKQPKKDATVLTAIKIEDEKFHCQCPVQQITLHATTSRGDRTSYGPRWPKHPSTGFCPECAAAGRDSTVHSTNPIREGWWIIEKSRHSGAGITIPFTFEGEYMLIEEVRREQRPAQSAAATASFFTDD